MKALIVGNRPLGSKIIELAKDKLVVAADAGADRLLKYNLIPDIVIGDLDSITNRFMFASYSIRVRLRDCK